MNEIIIPYKFTLWRRAERVMSYLINDQFRRGNQIIVVVCYEHDDEYVIPSEVKKIVIGKKNLIRQSIQLRKIIKKEQPDLCISFMQGGNFRLSLATLFSTQKYIISIRNDPKKEYPSKISQIMSKILFRRANGIVFQTEQASNFFSNKIRNKSTIIANPVCSEFFDISHNNDSSGIVSLGRLVEQKNFRLLINAYSQIVDEITDDLYIYGEGELYNDLDGLIKEKALENRIHLMGRTNNTKMVLKNSKCFVMSSDFEGMPNALMEAICMLVPSISTDCPCGGAKYLLQNDNGILVPIRNVNALSNAIKNVCNNYELRYNFSKKCEEFRNEISEEIIMKRWNDYFELILNERK